MLGTAQMRLIALVVTPATADVSTPELNVLRKVRVGLASVFGVIPPDLEKALGPGEALETLEIESCLGVN